MKIPIIKSEQFEYCKFCEQLFWTLAKCLKFYVVNGVSNRLLLKENINKAITTTEFVGFFC